MKVNSLLYGPPATYHWQVASFEHEFARMPGAVLETRTDMVIAGRPEFRSVAMKSIDRCMAMLHAQPGADKVRFTCPWILNVRLTWQVQKHGPLPA
jgi:hypothetical protein